MSQNIRRFATPIVIIIAFVCLAGCSFRAGAFRQHGPKVTLQVAPGPSSVWPSSRTDRLAILEAATKVLAARSKGVSGLAEEPRITIQGDDKIIMELPGVRNARQVAKKIISPATLEFYHLKDVQTTANPLARWKMEVEDRNGVRVYTFTGPNGQVIDAATQPQQILDKVVGKGVRPILTGADMISNAKASIEPQSAGIIINAEFNSRGAQIFRQFTRAHIGEIVAIFYNGRLLTAPTIRDAIDDGKVRISGFNNLSEARDTANLLNCGALPVPLKIVSINP